MEKIKDYLHLYFGCQCQFEDIRNNSMRGIGKLIEVGKNFAVIKDAAGIENEVMYFEVKPILRPLLSLTEEEKKAWRISCWGRNIQPLYAFSVWQIKILLENSFDIFNLIDAGLAIDATTLTAQVSDTTMPPQ